VAGLGKARPGEAWLGEAGRGLARQGKVAIAAAKIGCGGMNEAWPGGAGRGWARPGRAWQDESE
jgi:hypothetical protein